MKMTEQKTQSGMDRIITSEVVDWTIKNNQSTTTEGNNLE